MDQLPEYLRYQGGASPEPEATKPDAAAEEEETVAPVPPTAEPKIPEPIADRFDNRQEDPSVLKFPTPLEWTAKAAPEKPSFGEKIKSGWNWIKEKGRSLLGKAKELPASIQEIASSVTEKRVARHEGAANRAAVAVNEGAYRSLQAFREAIDKQDYSKLGSESISHVQTELRNTERDMFSTSPQNDTIYNKILAHRDEMTRLLRVLEADRAFKQAAAARVQDAQDTWNRAA